MRLFGTVAPTEVDALVGFQLLRPGRSANEAARPSRRASRVSAPSCACVAAASTAR